MNSNKTIKEIAALRDAAIENLMTMSDADLRVEAKEDGVNLESVAAGVRHTMREAAATALRRRMAVAKIISPVRLSNQRSAVVRPALDQMIKVIQQLFESKPSVGLAFRAGKRQSESDWQSLYDDLVAMGEIKEEDNEH